MSNEVAENLREIASNLLAAASRLDGVDVSADAMHQLPGIDHTGHAHPATDDAVRACQGGTMRVDNGGGKVVSIKMMTGRGFGVYVHRDPITPLQIGGCTWPIGQCSGHRTGLGGMPLLTVPDDQAVHVPHVHAPTSALPGVACSEIICHETHGRPCRYCGGAPCRITPLERGA